MEWLIPAVAASLVGAIALVLIFSFLYFEDRRRYLKIWAVSWIVLAAHFILQILVFQNQNQIPVQILLHLVPLGSGILLLWGTFVFLDRRIPVWWCGVIALGAIWIILAVAYQSSFLLQVLPTSLFLAGITIWTGWRLINAPNLHGIGKTVAGVAFLLLGLHRLGNPFLATIPWIATRVFLLSMTLEIIVALSLLLVYFELTHSEIRLGKTRLSAIVDNAAVGITRMDPATRFLQVNQRMAEMVGYTPEELLEQSWIQLTAPQDLEMCRVRLKEMLDGILPEYQLETRLVCKDGSLIWTSVSMSAIRTPTGQIDTLIGMITDITERKRAVLALYENEERFRYIIQHDPNAIAVLDRDLRYLFVSDRYIRDYRLNRSDLIGQRHYDIFPELPDRWKTVYQRALAGEILSSEEDSLTRADSTVDAIRWECRPWRDLLGNIGGIILYTEVITERKQADAALRRKTIQQERLLQTARHLAENLDVKEVLRQIASGARENLTADGCTIYLLSEDGLQLHPVVSVDPKYESQVLATPLDVNGSFTGQGVKAGRALIFNNAAAQPGGTQIPGTPVDEAENILVSPFMADNHVLGAMCLDLSSRPFNEEDLALAEAFAAYAATALKNAQAHSRLQFEVEERKRAEEAVQRKSYQQERLIQTARQMTENLELREVLLKIASGARDIMNATGCIIYFLEGDGSTLRPVVADEPAYQDEVLSDCISVEKSFTGQAILQRRSLIFNDIRPDGPGHQIAGTPVLEEERIIASPFIVDGQIVGAMCLNRIGDVFTPEELALAETFTAYGSTALKNAQDLGRLQVEVEERKRVEAALIQDIAERTQREREMETISCVARDLRSAHTREQMLPIILEQVMGTLEVDGALLALRDDQDGSILFELGLGHAAPLSGNRYQAGQGITGHIITSGQPFVTDRLSEDPRNVPLGSDDPPCMAGVPLIVQNETIGAILATRRLPFNEADVRLLQAVGEMAASAIHRAGLHEETQRRFQRLNALYNIDKAIAANFDLSTTLEIVLEQVTGQLDVHAAELYLFDPVAQILTCAAGQGYRSVGRSTTGSLTRCIYLGQGLAGLVALERKPLYLANLTNEQRDSSGRINGHSGSDGFGHATSYRQAISQVIGDGFLSYFGVPLIAKGELKGVLQLFHRIPLQPDAEWLGFLETLARQAAIAIDNVTLFNDLQRSNQQITHAYDITLEGWAKALELRDKETEGHSKRVVELTVRLARAVGLSDEELVSIRRGTLLHDIGKMGIPDNILLKEGMLSDEEWEIMRLHPVFAFRLLSPIPFLRPALDIPYCHHEKWDGSGYPRGLRGEEIPMAARLFALVDVWDALLSDRPYRPAWPFDKVTSYLRDQAGKHFDPDLVEVFIHIVSEQQLETPGIFA